MEKLFSGFCTAYSINDFLAVYKDVIKNSSAFFITRLIAGYRKQASKILIGFFTKIHKYFFRCPILSKAADLFGCLL
jgi:hypothetical protein